MADLNFYRCCAENCDLRRIKKQMTQGQTITQNTGKLNIQKYTTGNTNMDNERMYIECAQLKTCIGDDRTNSFTYDRCSKISN